MKKLIGNIIRVFLKSTEKGSADPVIKGILIEVDSDAVYVTDQDNVFVVPLDNVSYCTTDNMPVSDRKVIVAARPIVPTQFRHEPELPVEQENSIIDHIDVYINKQQVASIPIPPTFPSGQWSEQVLRVVMGNPDVKSNLVGKVQKEIDYYPGEVYIEVTDVDSSSQTPDNSENTFSMGGSPTTDYLSPAQMAARLSKVYGGGKQ